MYVKWSGCHTTLGELQCSKILEFVCNYMFPHESFLWCYQGLGVFHLEMPTNTAHEATNNGMNSLICLLKTTEHHWQVSWTLNFVSNIKEKINLHWVSLSFYVDEANQPYLQLPHRRVWGTCTKWTHNKSSSLNLVAIELNRTLMNRPCWRRQDATK